SRLSPYRCPLHAARWQALAGMKLSARQGRRSPSSASVAHNMFPRVVREALGLLTPGERRRGLVVLGMMVGMAFIETISVASVMPFLAVLGNPDIARTNPALAGLMRI